MSPTVSARPRCEAASLRVREFLRRSPVQIAFDIGIFFKGLDGVLEIVGGLLLFVVKPETIMGIIGTLICTN
jgi:uncharacterized membrane protein